MAPINASSVKLGIDATSSGTYTAITDITLLTLNMSADVIDVTTKDNDGRSDVISGLKSATLDFEGVYDDTASSNGRALHGYKNAKTTIAWEATDGTNYYRGNGLITSYSKNAERESAVTFSGTITVKGAITRTT